MVAQLLVAGGRRPVQWLLGGKAGDEKAAADQWLALISRNFRAAAPAIRRLRASSTRYGEIRGLSVPKDHSPRIAFHSMRARSARRLLPLTASWRSRRVR